MALNHQLFDLEGSPGRGLLWIQPAFGAKSSNLSFHIASEIYLGKLQPSRLT